MAVYKNLFRGLKELLANVEETNVLRLPNVAGTLSTIGGTETLVGKTLTSPTINSPTIATPVITAPSGASSTGLVIAKRVNFVQTSGKVTYTATVPIPAGATIHAIEFTNTVLWGGAAAVLDVGDTADPNGYFAAIDVKATDLVVGEILSTNDDGAWGGKNGAYLTTAGKRGPVATGYSGNYYGTATNILAVITVTTPGTEAGGRSFMTILYSVGEALSPVMA